MIELEYNSQALSICNPLGFRHNGNYLYFAGDEEMYTFFLLKLRNMFPGIFVDLPLLLSEILGLSIGQGEQRAEELKGVWGESDLRSVNLQEMDDSAYDDIAQLLEEMHERTGTKFNKRAFRNAFKFVKTSYL